MEPETGQDDTTVHVRAVQLADELLGLVDDERLWTQLGGFYETLATLFAELNDPGRARMYAELAIENWIEYAGSDHASIPRARDFIRKLKKKHGTEIYK
jgi:hypothetical protein